MSDILELKSNFLTKPFTSDILFSTSPVFVLRTVVVTKPLVSGILFSTSLISVLRAAAVTKQLKSGIFYQHLQFFSPNFVYLCCIDLCELKWIYQEFYFLNYLLSYLVC